MKCDILLVSNMYPSEKNPSYGIFVKVIERQLQDEGFCIVARAVMNKTSGIRKVAAYFRWFLDVHRGFSKIEDGIVYVHFVSWGALVVFLQILFCRKNFRLVGNVHGSDLEYEKYWHIIFRPFMKIFFRRANRIVAPSYFFREKLVHNFGVKPEKIRIAPSGGVDRTVFFPQDRQKARKSVGLENGKGVVFGYVSRMNKNKGWRIFLEACSLLSADFPNLRFLVAGGGDDSEEFSDAVSKFGIKKQIIRLGQQDPSKLPYVYNSLDLFVFPSYKESLGLVGLEALSCGVPVVASDLPGIREYLIPGKNGDVFEVGNSRHLVEKLRELLENPDLLMRYAQHCRESTESFAANSCSKKMATIFSEI